MLAVYKQTGKRAVDVAEAEQTKVVGANSDLLDRDVCGATEGETPSGQPAGPFGFAQGRPPALRKP
ncbi:MAG: hypothetical protein WA254_19655 [Candidatus Sulfotelmatobacter sp.]